MEHTFLQEFVAPLGPFALVLKALEHDLCTNTSHHRCVFPACRLADVERVRYGLTKFSLGHLSTHTFKLTFYVRVECYRIALAQLERIVAILMAA